MLTTIAFILIVLWLIGFVGLNVLGSFIHILLVIAVIMFLVRIIQGKNPIQ
ncbi:lmo0937 family membrane protein [Patescibacteria group bacterium]|nr:lmo0937 family membrane protein [Patescibacteria group bacterium]